MKKLLKTYFFLVSSVLLLGACSGYDNRNACLLSHIDSLLDVAHVAVRFARQSGRQE